MKAFFNKKGSFAIFALMIILSLLICVFAIIESAGQIAISSTANSFGHLWAKSLLSEYDLELRDRYGLYGFYSDTYNCEEKILKYVEFSFGDKAYIEYDRPSCSLEKYSLQSIENFKEQIEKISVKNTIVEDENIYANEQTMREINNQWIIESLPSYKKTEEFYLLGLINKIKDGFGLKDFFESQLIDKYIFNFFKDYMECRDLKESYFRNEVEYIITGQLSDQKSKDKVGDKIVNMRNMLNLYYLYSCTEKRESALALANTITPGIGAAITQAIILEAWAYAEARNDLKILYDNKTVPLLKNDSNWALSIENVFNEKAEVKESLESTSAYVLPQKVEGAEYGDYLQILLYGLPEETKLLRMMDLIQINMKFLYCDSFLLKDYYCGMEYTLEVNGIKHGFKDSYY